MVIIGADPHPGSHTAAALDRTGKVLASLTVNNDASALAELKAWSSQFSTRCWAIEGANNPFCVSLSHALAEQERLVDISPSLTSQYRSKRGRKKTDQIDAENVARALLANPNLGSFQALPKSTWSGSE